MYKIQTLLFLCSVAICACGPDNQGTSSYDLQSIGEPVGTAVHLLEYDDEEKVYSHKKCRPFRVVTTNSECNHTEIIQQWSGSEFEDLLNAVFFRGYISFPEALHEPFVKGGELFVSGNYEKAKTRLTSLLEEKRNLENFWIFILIEPRSTLLINF